MKKLTCILKRISRYSEVIVLFLAVQALSKLNSEDSVKLYIEILKNQPSSLHSPENAKFSHFTLLFCRGGKEICKDL